ncbi:RDD family protein [Streptomyces lunaelactis]|nr:RDD family protein [Streptomyces lunaelactis]NUK58100.1 RDD family protein [Streptomyces lunaelactis]
MFSPPEAAPALDRPTSIRPAAIRPAVSRRVLAWSVDFALVLTAAYLLAVLTLHRITDLVTDVPELATLSGWEILSTDGDARDRAEHLALSLWHEAVLLVIEAFVLLVICTFLYHWATLTLAGRTLGKKLLGLSITPHTSRRAALRAAVTTTADVACFALACCLLVSGAFIMSVVVWALAVAVFWTNALPALSSSGRTLADRMAGTSVVRVPAPGPSRVAENSGARRTASTAYLQ